MGYAGTSWRGVLAAAAACASWLWHYGRAETALQRRQSLLLAGWTGWSAWLGLLVQLSRLHPGALYVALSTITVALAWLGVLPLLRAMVIRADWPSYIAESLLAGGCGAAVVVGLFGGSGVALPSALLLVSDLTLAAGVLVLLAVEHAQESVLAGPRCRVRRLPPAWRSP